MGAIYVAPIFIFEIIKEIFFNIENKINFDIKLYKMANKIQLSKKVLQKLNDKTFIMKLAMHMNKDVQTIRKWVEANSQMLTLYQCYSFIQREFKFTDKEMFEEA